ncbi:glycosyltransferase [Pseudoalteromonas sp. C2R02]|uniref:glycosyltransferase n=1 Tax=Pseudoalteromonas sp. C2R02 TaxID=2841565 RepID=UPI001C0967EE|nr:glycosyltransferase [Pseudoalteromonas sp. C2R02]MBU2971411.1 glycosyltransferase [Pseudoalteromonas sp. C2R02]
MRMIVFGEDWGAHPSSTQHLIKEIAQSNSVSWINSVGMRSPKLSLRDFKRLYNKCKSIFLKNKKEQQYTEVKVYNPKVLPWHQFSWVNAFNKKQLKKTLSLENQSDEPITYWVSVPTAISLIDKREQDQIIYYCGDDFSGLEGVDYSMVEKFEKELIDQADIIYVVSDELMAKMPEEKTIMLRHGVDFKLFNHPKVINPMLKKHRPTIGFYGSLSNWLDIELLINLVKIRPEYDLLLIGEIKINLDKLLAFKNVSHIEAISHESLPEFSQHWQVALLPFVDNAQIRACDPLKLKEYLAAGVPVVATDFPAVHKYKEIIMIASSTETFIKRVDWAVCMNAYYGLIWRQVSAGFVKKDSWKNKSEDVLEQILKS